MLLLYNFLILPTYYLPILLLLFLLQTPFDSGKRLRQVASLPNTEKLGILGQNCELVSVIMTIELNL